MLQGLRQGHNVYLLERDNGVTLKVGVVESVSNPMPKYNSTYTPYNTEMVIDLKVKVDGEVRDYKQIPSNLSVANFGTTLISDSREAMLAEVEAITQASRQVLQSIDHHKRVMASCEAIVKQLNPTLAKEQEREEAIANLKTEMADIKESLKDIVKSLSKSSKS